MTLAEDRAHFSLWSMLAAPLIAGNDLRSIPTENLGTTKVNAEVPSHDVLMVRLEKLGKTDVHASKLVRPK